MMWVALGVETIDVTIGSYQTCHVFFVVSIIIWNFLILKNIVAYCFVSHISKDTKDCRHSIWFPLILVILALMWKNQAVTKMISTMCKV